MKLAKNRRSVVGYTIYIGKIHTTDSHNESAQQNKKIEKPRPIRAKRGAPKLLTVPIGQQVRKKISIPVIKISVNLTSIVSVIDLYLKYEHQIQDFISNLF